MQLVFGFPGRTVPPNPEMLSAEVLSRLAVAAEAAGWGGVSLDEHPVPPDYWRYSSDGHDAVDPFVALAAVTATTTRIRLFVHAALVAIRNPFLLAKSVATLDVLSKGRVELGMVTGYLPEEYEALGVPYEHRNEIFDENIEVMKLAWTGQPVNYDSSRFKAVEVSALPRPVQQPHPPLWIGGNSRLSMRRIVSLGAGWMAFTNPRARTVSRHTPHLESVDDFVALRKVLQEYAAEAGRTDPDVSLSISFRGDMTIGDLKRSVDEYREAGVRWLGVSRPASSVSESLRAIDLIAEEVIAR